MAANTSIPAKYIPVLTMYAAGILLQWQERKAESADMFNQADNRMVSIFCADDTQDNYRRVERAGI